MTDFWFEIGEDIGQSQAPTIEEQLVRCLSMMSLVMLPLKMWRDG